MGQPLTQDQKVALLVEDIEDSVCGTVEEIKNAGWRLIVANDATTAKDILRQNEIDVMILDLKLPPNPEAPSEFGVGEDLLASLREGSLGSLNQKKRVVAITGHLTLLQQYERDQLDVMATIWKLYPDKILQTVLESSGRG